MEIEIGEGYRRCPVAELGMRIGIKFGGAEGLQLAYLLPSLEWPMGSLGVHAGVRVWDKAMSNEEDIRR